MAESVKSQKKVYRQRIKTILDQLSHADLKQQSDVITKRVLELEAYQNAENISIFLSMPEGEISTETIVLRALKDGKRVFVPYIHGSKQSKMMDMLRVKDEDDVRNLKPDAWGIPSIAAESTSSRENALGGFGCLDDAKRSNETSSKLDVIFMPAMAFDQLHNRLGHGKGFYDRYLTRYKELVRTKDSSSELPLLVGLALREQILSKGEELPTTEQDWKVDSVVTADE